VIAERLRRLTGRGRRNGDTSTAIVVPVPDAARAVRAWGLAMEPHVTVLYPFLPAERVDDGLIADLREVLGAFPAFPFSLTEVRRFPGVVYLAPEPAAPFVALTEACARRWPEHQPYGGAFPDIVPHLTLAEGAEPRHLAERAATSLPIAATAREAWLIAPAGGGRWERRAPLPLAGD
jgi:2'-5' RNA ligase